MKICILQDRIEDIAFSNPSNFTTYCRQYLGDNYFDNLEDADEDGADADSSQLAEQEDLGSDDGTATARGSEGTPIVSEEGTE